MAEPPLHVAYVLDRYHQTSQTFVDLEIRHLRAAGHDVRILALRRGAQDRSSEDSRLSYLDPPSGGARASFQEHLRWVRHPLRYLRFLAVVSALRSEMGTSTREHVRWWRLPDAAMRLEQQGVEHLHTHFGWSGAASAACLSALTGIPWSMTLHARDIFSRQHNLAYKVKCADLVITVCEFNKQWLCENVADRPDTAVLTCGIEVVAPRDAPPDGADVVVVARLVPKKAVDVLVRAVAELADRGRTVSVEIIGDGPERDVLEALARDRQLSGVRFLGETTHAGALERIERARIFALPCRVTEDGDRDAMPTAIIEAMMRGLPVVATAVGGIPEFVDAHVGRVVPEEDAVALAAALLELLDDEQLRDQLGRAGAARARERFSATTQVSRLSALLRAVSAQ